MRAAPYVGISGVVSIAQQTALHAAAAGAGLVTPWSSQAPPPSVDRRRLLLGVKATHKTQVLDVPNKYGADWYPVGDGIRAALANDTGSFADGQGTMRVAQVYAEPESIAEDPRYLDAFVTGLVRRTTGWLTHVQFDMLPWDTEPATVAGVLDSLATIGIGVLLQAHGPAMSRLGPRGCAEALAPYAHTLTHVLFDASHGTGTRLDPAALLPFLDAAAESDTLAHVGLGVAGGLDAATLPRLEPLLIRHPDLSWDAEGRLHPERLDGSRPLNLDAAALYLRASATLLSSTPEEPRNERVHNAVGATHVQADPPTPNRSTTG